MAVIHRSAVVPQTPQQMYDLVYDVAAYPEFLHWCRNAQVVAEDDDSITGKLDIEFGPIKKSFTTRNRVKPGEAMTIELVDGPFSHMQGEWRFKPLPNGRTRISLDLDFAFRNRLFAAVAEPAFIMMGDNMVDSFKKRAEQVYG